MAKAKGSAGRDKGDYTSRQIQVLKGLEAVRKRPGMYIGSTSARGLHHLVYEVVDNSIDEAMAGYCSEIEVRNPRGRLDHGRRRRSGHPGRHPPDREGPGVELALTRLHAGGKFDKDTYKVSGGLHGVGVSVVNALSESLDVDSEAGRPRLDAELQRGVKDAELEKGAKTKETGTTVHFKPDHEIFTELQYSWDTLANRLRELAYLNRGVSISLRTSARTATRCGRNGSSTRAASPVRGVPAWQQDPAARRGRVPARRSRRARRSSSPCSTRTGTTRTRSRS